MARWIPCLLVTLHVGALCFLLELAAEALGLRAQFDSSSSRLAVDVSRRPSPRASLELLKR